ICTLYLYQNGIAWNEALEIVMQAYREVSKDDAWKETIKTVSGLKEFLHEAKKKSLRLGVVTSDNKIEATHHLKEMEIDSYFHSIIGHDNVELGKPFPDMVYKACSEMEVTPERTLIIGDSNGDMLLGKNSNTVASIGILAGSTNGENHLKDADNVIENYHSIVVERK